MSELTDVLRAIESLSARGERLALATIVAVRGSTYRRPGARLLVPEEGAPIGNISGGCLENDVADVARIVMTEGHARVVSFDLTADDDAVWGWGLGCNGAIELFVEPADKAAEVAGALRMALEEERPICMVTVLDSQVAGVEQGNRLLVKPDGATQGSLGDPAVDRAAAEAGLELLAAERSEVRELTEGVRAFVEVLEPPLRLVICGAGHDAAPLVAAAANLGWGPIVVDDRPAFLTAERFPQAAGFVALERPDAVAKRAPLDGRTFVVVMTHNFLRDKDYLRELLRSPVRSISMLGPGARTQRLVHELRDEGLEIGEAEEARLRTPAGLDLGAEGPEEIAAAIVAEIVALKRGRGGGFLRDRPGPIHERHAAARPTP
ncbi:MAG TPA: XdhC family protein [Actinomycetota bacterium]|nr:XdhC family protein [Actinomycetota bacterium]